MASGNYFLKLLGQISLMASFLPVIISLIKFKHIHSYIVPVFILIIISAIVEIIVKVYTNLTLNNFYIFHFYTVVEFVLISLFYFKFFRSYFNPILIGAVIPLFLIVCYIDYRINGLTTIDNFSLAVESISFTFYSLFLFYYLLKNLLFENLLGQPVFWLNTAFLIYFAGNLLLFVFSNYLIITDPFKHAILWSSIHSFFNILYNLLLSIGFWKTRRT